MRDKLELAIIYFMMAAAVIGICYIGYRLARALFDI